MMGTAFGLRQCGRPVAATGRQLRHAPPAPGGGLQTFGFEFNTNIYNTSVVGRPPTTAHSEPRGRSTHHAGPPYVWAAVVHHLGRPLFAVMLRPDLPRRVDRLPGDRRGHAGGRLGGLHRRQENCGVLLWPAGPGRHPHRLHGLPGLHHVPGWAGWRVFGAGDGPPSIRQDKRQRPTSGGGRGGCAIGGAPGGRGRAGAGP
jgi:hypothetical protein